MYSWTIYHVYIIYHIQNQCIASELQWNSRDIWSKIVLKLLNCLFIQYPYYTTCINQHLLFFLHVVTFWGPQHTSRTLIHEHTLSSMPKPSMKRTQTNLMFTQQQYSPQQFVSNMQLSYSLTEWPIMQLPKNYLHLTKWLTYFWPTLYMRGTISNGMSLPARWHMMLCP